MVDEKLFPELADVETNPFGWNNMHMKKIQMTTKLSDPMNGLEISSRILEECEQVNRGRNRAKQPLQCTFMMSEEWKGLVRKYEAQNLDTLQDKLKATMLAHNPQDSEWQTRQTERDEAAGV